MTKGDCGGCTLCCYLTEIRETNSPPFKHCRYCVPSKGCIVYTARPAECRTYWCSWAFDSNAHPSLRPDKLRVLFENINECLVLGIVEPGHDLSQYAARQVDAYLGGGSSVVVKKIGHKPLVYLARGASRKEVIRVIKDKLKEYQNDSAKLYNKLVNTGPGRVQHRLG